MPQGFYNPLRALVLASLSMAVAASAAAASLGDTPTSFFTNLAERFLQSQLNVSVTRIQISPTNQYSPALHRLLQVAANLYEASKPADASPFPSVFRPLFQRSDSTVFICGYTNDNDAATARTWFTENPEGIPMVIGARKGLPNFNEFVFQTFVQYTRKLELGRPATNVLPNQTNQILLLSLSNLFGVENWNSYSTPFANNFDVFVTNILSLTLSNTADGWATNPPTYQIGRSFAVNAATNSAWRFRPQAPSQSNYQGGFMIPLYTNIALLPTARYTDGGFDTLTNSFSPRTGQLPVPDWRLTISNRLIYLMSSSGAVVDAVSLSFQTNLNLTEFLMGQDAVYPSVVAALWDTNRISNPATLSTPTEGIMRQIGISLGALPISDSEWSSFNGSLSAAKDKASAIALFQGFVYNTNYGNTNLYQQAPFTAARRFVHTVGWQANDPLVHYLAQDLAGVTNELRFVKPNEGFTNNLNLGRLNALYEPWLGNPTKSYDVPDPNDTYVGIKDPGVYQSDDWNFPSDLMDNPGLVGRVHRGTPWQTVYLKAEVAAPYRWLRQSSDVRTHPTNDWKLASLFLALANTNDPRRLYSINQTSGPAWGAALNGLTVLSNTAPTIPGPSTNFDTLVMDSNSPQAQIIGDALYDSRLRRVPQYFREVGEILATRELTVESPWLNLSDEIDLDYGLTDEAYEKILERLLPLLRPDPVLSIGWVNGELHAQTVAFTGYWYDLESSTDLRLWTPFATHFAETDRLLFPEAIGIDQGFQFYRVRLVGGRQE